MGVPPLMYGLPMTVFFSNQRAADGSGRRFAAHWGDEGGSAGFGGAGLSAGERQRPAIPAETDRLWGPTHRGVRFGIHRVAPDALLLCHRWFGNAREMWGFGAILVEFPGCRGGAEEGESVVPAAPALRRFHPSEQARQGPRPSAERCGSSTRLFVARVKVGPLRSGLNGADGVGWRRAVRAGRECPLIA
jgi:hypothetical protein